MENRTETYLHLVNLSSKGQRDGHRYPLLEQAAELSVAVNLGTESRGAEVVFGTEGGGAVSARSTHQGSSRTGSELEVHIDTSLNPLRQLLPVGRGNDTLGLQLRSCDPVLSLVLRAVRERSFRTSVKTLSLPHCLETESETGGYGLKVASDENSGKTAFQEGWVESLERRREIGSSVVVIDLQETLCRSGHDLSIGLGNQRAVPAVVSYRGEGTIASKVALHEDLLKKTFSPSDHFDYPNGGSKLDYRNSPWDFRT